MIDVDRIREDFPNLSEKVYGKDLIYLDNAATSHRPRCVIDRMNEYYFRYNSNVHRGVHYLSNKCTDANEEARETVRKFLGASSVKEIIFTRGTTESINLVAYTFAEAFLKPGDEVLVSEMEHHANIVPWQLACERKGAVLKVIPFNDKGELQMADFERLLSPKTRLVGIAYVSNVLGTVNPVRDIIAKAHAAGARVLVDAAQAVAHIPIDVTELDCDFLAFSGHKIYGPTGIGVLYGKQELLGQLPPWQGGGEMISEVTFRHTSFNVLPFKFEAGTPDFIGIIGLGRAIEYVASIGLEEISEYEHFLAGKMDAALSEIPDIRKFGTAAGKSAVFSFLVGNIHPFDMGTLLDHLGIAVRTGHLCADPVMQHYKIPGLVRASLAMYNTEEEIGLFKEGLKRVVSMF